jgi:hypothetical protein
MHIIENFLAPRAKVHIHQERRYDFDEKRGLWLYKQVGEDEEASNIITNTGRVQIHTQCYGTTGLLTNGFNYIALTNDSGVPSASDTSLTSEITTNGLQRVQGSVVLPTGSGTQTTVSYTFTFTGSSQQVQKTALFTAGYPGGVMCHEIAFTQRTIYDLDTLAITFTISTN